MYGMVGRIIQHYISATQEPKRTVEPQPPCINIAVPADIIPQRLKAAQQPHLIWNVHHAPQHVVLDTPQVLRARHRTANVKQPPTLNLQMTQELLCIQRHVVATIPAIQNAAVAKHVNLIQIAIPGHV